MEKTKNATHVIDATGQPLGRLAVRVAVLLRGKDKVDFRPHENRGDEVVVKNTKHMKFTGKKFKQKIYYRHSGYMGGLKGQPLSDLFGNRPTEVLRRAVWGMLPKNRLRNKAIKRLTIEE